MIVKSVNSESIILLSAIWLPLTSAIMIVTLVATCSFNFVPIPQCDVLMRHAYKCSLLYLPTFKSRIKPVG